MPEVPAPPVEEAPITAPAPVPAPASPQLGLPFNQVLQCADPSCNYSNVDPNQFMTDVIAGNFTACNISAPVIYVIVSFNTATLRTLTSGPEDDRVTNTVCNGCFNEDYATCPNCSRPVPKEDLLLPTDQNRGDMKEGGCNQCSVECESCQSSSR